MLISKHEPFKKETTRQVRLIEIFRVLIDFFLSLQFPKVHVNHQEFSINARGEKKQDTYRLKNV
jgi:hypothetical protein